MRTSGSVGRNRVWLLRAILKDAFWKFFEDDGTFLASGLAFGLLIYCIPFALLSVSALSYTIASSDTALAWLRQFSITFIPQFHDAFDDAVAAIIDKRGLLGAVGFVAFIFASSATFGSFRLVLNRVFGVREPRGLIHGKAMEMVMMLATSLLLFLIIAIVYLINVAQGLVANLWFMKVLHPAAVFMGSLVGLFSTLALFCFLYRFSPAETLSREALFVASMTATCLFEISKLVFGAYIAYAQGSTALYGALSAPVFFFLWLYYASIIFVFGAEVGWAFDHRM